MVIMVLIFAATKLPRAGYRLSEDGQDMTPHNIGSSILPVRGVYIV